MKDQNGQYGNFTLEKGEKVVILRALLKSERCAHLLGSVVRTHVTERQEELLIVHWGEQQ